MTVPRKPPVPHTYVVVVSFAGALDRGRIVGAFGRRAAFRHRDYVEQREGPMAVVRVIDLDNPPKKHPVHLTV